VGLRAGLDAEARKKFIIPAGDRPQSDSIVTDPPPAHYMKVFYLKTRYLVYSILSVYRKCNKPNVLTALTSLQDSYF
jgi:hypothetical protein